MKTKRPITWKRTFSSAGSIEVPAGAPVEYSARNKTYYVQPRAFEGDDILKHDAIHYGCPVEIADVDFEESCGGCKHLSGKMSRIWCGKSNYNLSGTLERHESCKFHGWFEPKE